MRIYTRFLTHELWNYQVPFKVFDEQLDPRRIAFWYSKEKCTAASQTVLILNYSSGELLMFIVCQEAEPTPFLVGCDNDTGKNQPRRRVEEGGSEGCMGKHVPE